MCKNNQKDNENNTDKSVHSMPYYTVKSWKKGETYKLFPCPFCGGEPDVKYKGNDYTKTRKVTVKCKKCRCQRTDAAMRNGMEWLEEIAIKNWNQKPSV